MSALESAINGLLSGDNVQISRSNEFLIQFVETNDAWKASLDLFQSSNEHVRFFASNILYTKIKRHWSQLNSSQQDDIYRILINIVENLGQYNTATLNGSVRGSNEYHAFVGRVLLSLCSVCLFANEGLRVFLDIAFRKVNLLLSNGMGGMMGHGNNQSPSDSDCVNALCGLEMLNLLPTEVDSMDVGATTREQLESQLVKCSSMVMETVDRVSACGVTTGQVQEQFGADVHIATIKVLRAWLLQGITLTNLYEDHEVALRLVCSSLESDDPDRVKIGSSFLRELVCVSDYPRSNKRDEAVILLIHSFVRSAPLLAPYFDLASDRGDQDVAYEICYCMVSIASQEILLTTSQQYCNVEFFRLLLSCATLKPRKIASLTFDLWLSLQDTPVAERHPYTHQEIFESLLGIILKQSMYPDNFTDWKGDTDDDEDDFGEFRDRRHGIQDVLLICCYALREKFFDILGTELTMAMQRQRAVAEDGSSPLGGSGAGAQPAGWQEIECVLFVLHNCMEAVKGLVKSESSKSSALQFLASILQLIFSLPPHIIHRPELQCTICQTLGSLTFLIANANASSFSSPAASSSTFGNIVASAGGAGGNDGSSDGNKGTTAGTTNDGTPHNIDYTAFFLPALNALFECLASPAASMHAAKAILQLCVHGQKILIAPSVADGAREGRRNPLMDTLISITTLKITDEGLMGPPEDPLTGSGASSAGAGAAAAAAHPLLTVIEAVVRTVMALPLSHVAEALTHLGRPIAECLRQQVSMNNNAPNFERVALLLQYAGQLIRFSDAVEDQNVLIEFLSLLWEQLRVLETDTRWNSSSIVLNSLFDVYGRALMSAKNLVIPEVPRITQTVVTAFQLRSASSTYSMQCASVIVEALCNQGPEKDIFLVQLLEHCTRVLVGHAGSSYERYFAKNGSTSDNGKITAAAATINCNDQKGIFGYDPECIEKFFRFIYSYFIMCPNVIAQSPGVALSHLPQLSVYCLLVAKENSPVRLILTIIQSFWSGGSSKRLDPASRRALLSASMLCGKELVAYLIDATSGRLGISSILWPNVIDTLYYVINGCDEANQVGLAREWIGSKMAEEGVYDRVQPAAGHKELVYDTMFLYASQDRRRFKQLMHDVCKISCGEVDSEVLAAYQQ